MDRFFRKQNNKTIALVACVSKKQNTPRQAKDLYISDWFGKASTFAKENADNWYILSAKYGLLDPDAIIEPYNETLNRMPIASRRYWAQHVLDSLRLIVSPGDRIIILAGNRYRENLVVSIREMGCIFDIPMEGLRIGEQLRWLGRQINK